MRQRKKTLNQGAATITASRRPILKAAHHIKIFEMAVSVAAVVAALIDLNIKL